jgi:ubiquitin-like-conjugating enzyme ATG10
MAHHSEYRQWPFLTPQEFDVACSYFDRRYIQAKLGPVRKIFKISHHRSLTTAASYVEILRLLQLPKDPTGLIRLLEKLGAESVVSEVMDIDTPMAEEQDDVSIASLDGGCELIQARKLYIQIKMQPSQRRHPLCTVCTVNSHT